ncbi:hypothetical protein EYR40_007471 [Pleurotus pulmonarius]|nr:hypothetical protein EYR40_007471 [Pleurotus pulmonarius]
MAQSRSQVVSLTGCGGAADALSCLRAANVAKLQAANVQINQAGFYGTLVTVPRALLAVTNTHEGNAFVNQSTASTATAADYVLRLFPDLGATNAATVSRLYAGIGAPMDQVNAIMGESIFICPTYFMLNAFPAASENLLSPMAAMERTSHSTSPRNSDLISLPLDLHTSPDSGRTPAFNNPAFITSFSGAFLDFATSMDPNRKIDSGNTTPLWLWHLIGHSEMLFNRTVDGQPDIRAIATSGALLQRCAFWESVGHLTAQ